ncbi:sterol-sensing domain of SREBP cleavage-activation-domain-containing protein [Boeremia exigua]|uniref:sterol-sensing domain of SREBP cleavage-activation-domain-containing protein n=1 Tax=Boeremia exigua TaxID=749465 RepID=UPI001E8D2572|nr:sterol-sensing domain of SREBP cleavage-activation-domain-containing protein [Boeremia exigua]KAH6615279.1 sterol-sensing domain of SREBP cleavage-activation-domain-containing protein [Boeremia exigua]
MIWFLLYPLRGTTEPPKLSPAHPIRRAFHAHGTATAQHWQLSLVVTISVSVLLCFPAVFQAHSPAAAGLRNLPQHVWTSTTEVEGDRPADVVVRQAWVHGDYMGALNQSVLRKALHVQHALINGGFDAKNPRPATMLVPDHLGCVVPGRGERWGWQSPLMYWACSQEALDSDNNILATINARSRDQTPMNLTLRPSTVFAGKRFINTELQAADALVVSLFDRTENADVEDMWTARARALAQTLESDWVMFPQDGQTLRNSLYEFRLKPMSRLDDLFLAASYMATSVYVIWKMMQLRAVKSWFGLLITIGVKMAICIIASFSLCTWLGIDLARIPRPWFPSVVFCYGLGNIFRLINAVLETPPEMPPHQRIGNALGEVGHLSLAVAFQNLALIYLCSRFVSPWVADFCVFAAVTLVFDFVYHLTFFVAVLSVDVQRMELSDSIGQAHGSKRRPERQSWFAALMEGTTPLSTRFAGTVAIFSIILAINLHFFDFSDQQLSFATVRKNFMAKKQRRSTGAQWASPPINQARTPAEWLKLQDHNTAKELFALIKPGAYSFIARIYDPILVVRKGAQGRDKPQVPTTLIGHLRRFAQGHTFPAALMAVFLIAGVTLLMNYLLWTGLPEVTDEEEDNEASFSVKTLPSQQTLDIVHMSACPKGYLVGISLDRTTSIWMTGRTGYMPTTLQTACMKPKLWPIVASAMDESGTFLAIATDAGRIGMWSLPTSRFVMFPNVDFRGQVPALFSFVSIMRHDNERPYVVILSPDGYLTELEARTGIHRTKRISATAILCAEIYVGARGEASLVFVCKPGEVHVLSLQEPNNTSSEVVASLDPGPPPDSNPSKIQCLHAVPSLGLIFALRDERAEIFDFSSKALIHAFEIGHLKQHSIRVMHSARRQCPCGAPAVQTLSVVYAEQDRQHMIMQTFSPEDSLTSQICLGKPLDRAKHACRGLDSAAEAVLCVDSAGVWESTGASSVVGVRRRTPSAGASSVTSDDEEDVPNSITPTSAIRQRASKPESALVSSRITSAFTTDRRHTYTPTDEADLWEAWSLSSTGDFRARSLRSDDHNELEDDVEDDLFVVAPGPITRLAKRSVAVGFGNTVKIITIGKELFDGMTVQSGGHDIDLGGYRVRGRRGTDRRAL